MALDRILHGGQTPRAATEIRANRNGARLLKALKDFVDWDESAQHPYDWDAFASIAQNARALIAEIEGCQ